MYEKLGGITMFRISVMCVVTMFIVFGFQVIGAGIIKADELDRVTVAANADIDQTYADLMTLYAPIRFECGDHSISQDYMDILTDKANILIEHPGLRLVIEGHVAPNEPNGVGDARMVYVQDTLLRLGVPYKQVREIINYGNQYPVHDDGLEVPGDEHMLSRRVNFVVLGSY